LIKETVKSMQESKATSREKDNELFAQAKMKMVRAHMTYLNFYVYLADIQKQ